MTDKAPQITLSVRVAPELGSQVDAFAEAHGLANRTAALRALLKIGLAGTTEVPAAINGTATSSLPVAQTSPPQAPSVASELRRMQSLLAHHAEAHLAVARALIGNQMQAASDVDREAAREFLRTTFAPLLAQSESEVTP